MDLNQLLFQHQSAILRKVSQGMPMTGSSFDLVQHYKLRIDRLRQALGVSPYPDWCASHPGDAA